MAKIYLRQIKLGKYAFKDVPKLWKEQVRELLKEAGLDELIIE